MTMKRKLIAVVGGLIGAISLLLIAAGCYNSYARGIIQDRLENAPREPGTNILKGASPVSIDKGRDRICLLLHGYSSSPADFGQLPQYLDSRGWDVEAPLLPAHGRDPRDLRDITADDLVSFARKRFRKLKKEYDTVVLGGFSMGGSLALILTDEKRPAATFLINPYLGSTYRFYYILPPEWWYSILRPLVDYGVQLPGRIPLNRTEARNQFVHYHAAPASIYAEVFELRSRALRAVHREVPVLFLISEDDDTASPGTTVSYFHRTNSPADRLATFPGSNHVLMLDYGREKAMEAVGKFLRQNVPGSPHTNPSP